MYQEFQLEKKNKIYYLTMNRPEALNALASTTAGELHRALDEIEADDEVKIVIITGSGKAFIAGADIKYMRNLTPAQAQKFAQSLDDLYRRMEASEKIFIAAVNGFAFGGGCELSLACDIRIASEKAKFGLPEVSLGIIPGGGGTQRLARICGEGRAKRLIFTGEPIRADKAEAYGLVSDVTEPEKLLEKANEIAEAILRNGPQAVSYAKSAIHIGGQMDLSGGVDYEMRLFGLCFADSEQKEGMSAFIEKRKANF